MTFREEKTEQIAKDLMAYLNISEYQGDYSKQYCSAVAKYIYDNFVVAKDPE